MAWWPQRTCSPFSRNQRRLVVETLENRLTPSASTEIPVDVLLAVSQSEPPASQESRPTPGAEGSQTPTPPAPEAPPASAQNAVFAAMGTDDDLSGVVPAPGRAVDDLQINTEVFRTLHVAGSMLFMLTPAVETPLLETPLVGPVGVAGFEEANNAWRTNVESPTVETDEPALIVPNPVTGVEAHRDAESVAPTIESVTTPRVQAPVSRTEATAERSTTAACAPDAEAPAPRRSTVLAALGALLWAPRLETRLRTGTDQKRRGADQGAASRGPPANPRSHDARRGGERLFRPVFLFA